MCRGDSIMKGGVALRGERRPRCLQSVSQLFPHSYQITGPEMARIQVGVKLAPSWWVCAGEAFLSVLQTFGGR